MLSALVVVKLFALHFTLLICNETGVQIQHQITAVQGSVKLLRLFLQQDACRQIKDAKAGHGK
jgi:hypothetical protein